MTYPKCAWCGSVLIGNHRKLEDGERTVRLHFSGCTLKWIECERALGHRLPGEAPWRPEKGGKRG